MRCRVCELPGGSPNLPAGQRWVVPMRVTPATIRPRQGVRCQSWCLEWDTASGPTLSVLLGTRKWKTSRVRPAPGSRIVGRANHGSDDPWTRSWSGRRMSARDWLSKTRTYTTRSWAKCWVSNLVLYFVKLRLLFFYTVVLLNWVLCFSLQNFFLILILLEQQIIIW